MNLKIQHVIIAITRRCNYDCNHCIDGGPANIELPGNQLKGIIKKLLPFGMRTLTLTGGEPLLYRNFNETLSQIKELVKTNGLLMLSENRDQYASELLKCSKKDSSVLDKYFRIRLYTNGYWLKERDVVPSQKLTQLNYIKTGVTKCLNDGHDLSDSYFNTQRIETKMIELKNLGISDLVISIDDPHKQYARSIGLNIPYNYIKNISLDFKKRMELSKIINFSCSGNGSYIIPIRKARNLSDEEIFFEGNATEIREQLKTEFCNWQTQPKTHCYCLAQEIFQNKKDFEKKKNKHFTFPFNIDADGLVYPCNFRIFHPIGSIIDQPVEEIIKGYQKDGFYRILGEKGPQELARRLGISEKRILSWFLERTPCGLCEDLSKRGRRPQPIHGQPDTVL